MGADSMGDDNPSSAGAAPATPHPPTDDLSSIRFRGGWWKDH
jgi:hypothetical protein